MRHGGANDASPVGVDDNDDDDRVDGGNDDDDDGGCAIIAFSYDAEGSKSARDAQESSKNSP